MVLSSMSLNNALQSGPENEVTIEFNKAGFPPKFAYDVHDGDDDSDDFTDEWRPRVMFMGLRKAGKTSILHVVFHKTPANETFFIETTEKIIKEDVSNSSFVQLQLWDFPGEINVFDSTYDCYQIFKDCGALVYVIDAQTDYLGALSELCMTFTKIYKFNSNIKFEVFINKVDGLGEDCRMECQRECHQRAMDDLADAGYSQIHITFHLTTIYDFSVFEAISKVIQKLIPQLPALENLLNILNTNSAIEKSFLFDIISKLYIATDSTPVDMQSYELCTDMIDMVVDISWIYGSNQLCETNGFDERTSSLIQLNNGTVLYLRQVDNLLALVCILREDNYDRKGIIDYNFICFREALQQVFDLRDRMNMEALAKLRKERSIHISLTHGTSSSPVPVPTTSNTVAASRINVTTPSSSDSQAPLDMGQSTPIVEIHEAKASELIQQLSLPN